MDRKLIDQKWDRISSKVRALLNIGMVKREWLDKCRIARLIVATPFLAGCKNPEETAFIHLLTYLSSLEPDTADVFFNQIENGDSLEDHLLFQFPTGNDKIIQHSNDLIFLSLLNSFKNASVNVKYNPVAEGYWDYDGLSERVISRILKDKTSPIASLYTLEDAMIGDWKL